MGGTAGLHQGDWPAANYACKTRRNIRILLGLRTVVVCDMIPADCHSPSNFVW
jgi:hypothetical protein